METQTPENKKIDEKSANKSLIITGIVVALLVVGLLTNGFGLFNNSQPTGEDIPLSIDNSPVLGNANAPITIYEFSDFSCPFCAAAAGYNPSVIEQLKKQNPLWQAPLPLVIENYVNTGKAKLVYKYALGHGTGRAAELVGWALNDQNPELFWKFHDLAFENQADTGDIVKMKALAMQLGANMTKLESDIYSGKYDSYFDRDESMAKSNGVEGTPSFIINGKLISGAQSYSEFKKILDSQ